MNVKMIALYLTALDMPGRTAQLRARLRDDRGQTSVEWLGIAMVILAIVVILANQFAQPIGQTISTNFTNLLNGATNGSRVGG